MLVAGETTQFTLFLPGGEPGGRRPNGLDGGRNFADFPRVP